MIFVNNALINVTPGASTQTGACTLDADSTFLTLIHHMHETGVHMRTRALPAGGAPLVLLDVGYDFNEQSVVPIEPRLELAAGDKIEVTCDYENPGTNTLTFGESTFEPPGAPAVRLAQDAFEHPRPPALLLRTGNDPLVPRWPTAHPDDPVRLALPRQRPLPNERLLARYVPLVEPHRDAGRAQRPPLTMTEMEAVDGALRETILGFVLEQARARLAGAARPAPRRRPLRRRRKPGRLRRTSCDG